jgi:hypothetical protein
MGRERYARHGSSRIAPLSPLMQAKSRTDLAGTVNFCPFKCEDEDLDESGYCRHLVGFTNGQTTKEGTALFERMIIKRDRRQVMVRREKLALPPDPEDTDPLKNNWKWGKPILEEVLPTDILERVTTCSRVYRDVDAERAKAEAEKAKIEHEAAALVAKVKGSK